MTRYGGFRRLIGQVRPESLGRFQQLEEASRCSAGLPEALFPTLHRFPRDIQQQRQSRLGQVAVSAETEDALRVERRWRIGNDHGAGAEAPLSPFRFKPFLEGLLQSFC